MGELTEKAVAKLEEELKNAKNKEFAEAVIKEFLVQRVSESDTFAEAVMQEHKAWSKCEDYIQSKAKKQAKGQHSIAIRNDVVYEWAEDYFRLDDKAIKEAKKKEAEEKAKKQAAEKKESKSKAPNKDIPKKERARSDYNTTLKSNTDNHKLSAKEILEVKNNLIKRSDTLEGQMSIFDMLGE